MPATWTLEKAFRHFGAEKRNPRWSVSARSPDGRTVVLTLWKDRFDHSSRPMVYDRHYDDPRERAWIETPGSRERTENLLWARDNCGGLFRVVITVSKDTDAYPRQIAECYPHEALVMRLTHLDTETGEFRAEQASETSNA